MNNLKKKPRKILTNIGKIQQIEWTDHNSYFSGGWKFPQECEVEATGHTIGKVIYEDKEYVQLASNWSGIDDKLGVVMNIVKSCIRKRRTLK